MMRPGSTVLLSTYIVMYKLMCLHEWAKPGHHLIHSSKFLDEVSRTSEREMILLVSPNCLGHISDTGPPPVGFTFCLFVCLYECITSEKKDEEAQLHWSLCRSNIHANSNSISLTH